jgi:F0F1-type ATP synthase membrane subunit b/b'
MEMALLKGVAIPVTPWVVIHQDKVLDVLDKIRASIPGEVQEANIILKRRDEIQMDAHNRAEQIINEANLGARRMVEDSEILKAVKVEAEKIRAEVIEECRKITKQAQDDSDRIKTQAINEAISIREGSDKYAETVMTRLDTDLSELTSVVSGGQSQLSKLKADSAAKIANYRSQLSPSLPFDEVSEGEPAVR